MENQILISVKERMSRFSFLFFGVLIFISNPTFAHEGHIFFPAAQMRYENDVNQSLSQRQHRAANLAVQFEKRYLVQGEYVEFNEESVNGSIQINSEFREFNLGGGYIILSHPMSEPYNIYFDIVPMIYLGENITSIDTNVSGTSQSSNGELNFNYALGALFNLKLNFLLFQGDVRYAYSRSYSPNAVYIYGARVGIRFGF